MAKETNHRRKSKSVRKVEELDVEGLTKELVKPKHKPKNNYQQNKDKRKDYKPKPKNQEKQQKNEERNEKNKKPYNKNKKNYKPKDKRDSKWVPFFFAFYFPLEPNAPVPRSDGICCRFSYGISSITNLGTGTTNACAIPFS